MKNKTITTRSPNTLPAASHSFSTIVSSDGRINLFKAIRKVIDTQPGDRVEIQVENKKLLIRRLMQLEEIAEAVPPLNRPEDFNALLRQTNEELVEHYLAKMKSGDA